MDRTTVNNYKSTGFNKKSMSLRKQEDILIKPLYQLLAGF